MKKPEIKFQDGKLFVQAAIQGDFDNDQKPSVVLKTELEIDAYEAVTEIAKKDIAILEMIIKQIKAG
ncbi:MAG: hypothetical protein ACK41T_00650 [Pseudobdellovibrio sp.]